MKLFSKIKEYFDDLVEFPLDEIAKVIGWFVVITSIIPLMIIGITNILTPITKISADVVIGHSDFPKILPGSIIFLKETKNLKVGDFACYVVPSNKCSINPYISPAGSVICHQVIRVYKYPDITYYKFKGYYNKIPDPCKIADKYVVGKIVFQIPMAGIGVIPWYYYMKTLWVIATGGYIT